MSDQTANLALPLILGSQAQKHVTHNEALQRLDALVQLAVISRSVTEPPIGPPEGARYLLPTGALGAWAGQDGALAIFAAGAWQFLTSREGWRAFVLDEAVELVFAAGAWEVPPLPELSQLDGVGIMTGYDAVNRLSVAAEATLLSHAGAGHQLKLNKAAAGETASLLFQSNWSGRAEIGLAGEIRAIGHVDVRVREAERLGFLRFILPASNVERLTWKPKISLIGSAVSISILPCFLYRIFCRSEV